MYHYAQKHTLFSNFARFCTPNARTLPGPEKQPLLREFFYEDDIQLQIQVAPWGLYARTSFIQFIKLVLRFCRF